LLRLILSGVRLISEDENLISYHERKALFWLHVHSADATCNSHRTGVFSVLNVFWLPIRLHDNSRALLNIYVASRQLPPSLP
jgi:hypothetical protein